MSQHYHFIGVGGIGMSAIASLLIDKGFRVSGSDIRENNTIKKLRAKGAQIFIGHDVQNLSGADCVVHSSAIRMTNPEMIEAVSSGMKVLKRAQVLAQLVNEQKGITVAGAHGKTTTSSLISYLLLQAGLHPTTAVGGILNEESCSANLGEGEYFVAEVDESDGSFLYFKPYYSIITNIDQEHMDYYKTWENLCNAYQEFINKTNPLGAVIYCGDDKTLKALVKQVHPANSISYGLSSQNDVWAKNIRQQGLQVTFDCVVRRKKVGSFCLNLSGEHNLKNALAVIALAVELDIPLEAIEKPLETFPGVRRRFQCKGVVDDITVVDDYGHHPTEIKATLKTAQSLNYQRVIVVFQPHRYTRTKLLLNDFAQVLPLCDELILTDVYAAGEKPVEGVGIDVLMRKLDDGHFKKYHYIPRVSLVEGTLDHVQPGDLLITLGAGDITQVSDEIVELLLNGTKKVTA